MVINISLTPHLEAFVAATLQSGRFQTADEVVCTAIRLLEEFDLLDRLRTEIRDGLDSGPVTPMTEQDWDELKRRVHKRAQAHNGK
jgi:antitoxin ParD1/3/4